MKKLLTFLLFLVFLFGYDINLTRGWQMLGALDDINVQAFNNQKIAVVWTYDETTKQWAAYSPIVDLSLYPKINPLSNIEKGKGFWVLSRSSLTVDTNVSVNDANNTSTPVYTVEKKLTDISISSKNDYCKINYGDGNYTEFISCPNKITYTYKKPGIYRLSIYNSDNNIIAKKPIIVQNKSSKYFDGYVSSLDGYMEENEKIKDFYVDDKLYISSSLSEKSYYWTNFVFIQNDKFFKSTDGNNFKLEAKVKNSQNDGGISAYDTTITVYTDNGKSVGVSMMGESWAVSWIHMWAGDDREDELDQLVVDFTKFRKITFDVNDSDFSVYADDKLLYTLPFNPNLGKIVGCKITFKGSGILDYIKLNNKNGDVIYENDFDLNDTSSSNKIATKLKNLKINDLYVDNNAVYVLGYKMYDESNYWTRPDGRKYYDLGVYLYKITNDNITEKMLDHYITENNNNMALFVDDNEIKAFVTKSDQNSYAMSGFIYTLDDRLDLTDEKTLFTGANWGWFPVFTDADTLSHFSFAGYYRMQNADNKGSVEPSVMQDEYDNARVKHSNNIYASDDNQTIENIVNYFN